MKNDNKLIAEFMGYKVVDKPKVVNGENFFEYIDENGNYTYCISLLKYDTWNWLMPVVQKIEQVNQGVPQQMLHLSLYSTIDEVYQAVVEFIKNLN